MAKWYFCSNLRGLELGMESTEVALRSCLERTTLEPHLLYSGPDHAALEWLAARGVTIHRHELSFEQSLVDYYGERFDRNSGHWLRLEIPLVEERDEFVLYTDLDVMFLTEPDTSARPRTIAGCPDLNNHEPVSFNSGVMMLNVHELRRQWPQLRSAICDLLRIGSVGDSHDQLFYAVAFATTREPLNPLLNHRVTQGVNPAAQIVHFQKPPKPHELHEYFRNPAVPCEGDTEGLLMPHLESFAHYYGQYLGFLDRSRAAWGEPPVELPRSVRDLPDLAEPEPLDGVLYEVGESRGFAGVSALHGVEQLTPWTSLRIRASHRDPAILLPPVSYTRSRGIELQISLSSPVATLLAVYYLLPGMVAYTEECTVWARVRPGLNTLTMTIPQAGIHGRMRLDPGEAKAEYELHAVKARMLPDAAL